MSDKTTKTATAEDPEQKVTLVEEDLGNGAYRATITFAVPLDQDTVDEVCEELLVEFDEDVEFSEGNASAVLIARDTPDGFNHRTRGLAMYLAEDCGLMRYTRTNLDGTTVTVKFDADWNEVEVTTID